MAWTAIEVARSVRRPRALATLDAALRNDRRRTAALTAVGWMIIAIVFEDVRYRPGEMVDRISAQLRHAPAA